MKLLSHFQFLSLREGHLARMPSSILEYASTLVCEQRWYMDHLLPEHLIRISWCLILMCFYALIELDYLPGKRWKIRKDMQTSGAEITFYIAHSLVNMLKWHIAPLILYEIFLHRPASQLCEVPTWWTILWKTIAYTLIFDLLTHLFHHVTHIHPHVAAYFHRAHAVHHASCGRYIYAWNGFYSSALEAVAGLVFFLVAMIPLRMDPVTRLVSIFTIHLMATNTHSGYDFPWMFHNWSYFGRLAWHGSVGHYYHHQLGRKNLSTFWTFLDRLSGTHYNHLSQSPIHPNEFIYRRQ